MYKNDILFFEVYSTKSLELSMKKLLNANIMLKTCLDIIDTDFSILLSHANMHGLKAHYNYLE